jgi:hypothetical protein
MPVCCVCQGDGVMEAVGNWYCVDHLEDGVVDVVRYVANVRGWNVDETERQITEWLEQ